MSLDNPMTEDTRYYRTPPACRNQKRYNYHDVLLRERGNEHKLKLWIESPSHDVCTSRRTPRLCNNSLLVQRRQFLMRKRVPFLKMRLPSNRNTTFDGIFTSSRGTRQIQSTQKEEWDLNTLPCSEKNLDDASSNQKRIIEELVKGKNGHGDCDFFLDNPRKLAINVEKKGSTHCCRKAIISTIADSDEFILDYPPLGVDVEKRKSSFVISMRPRELFVVK